MRKNSATQKIKEWLETGNVIDTKLAVAKFDTYRLGGLIYHLRNRYGMTIKTKRVYDGKRSYVQYYICKQEKKNILQRIWKAISNKLNIK